MMMGVGVEFTAKQNDIIQRAHGAAMGHDGGPSAFEVVGYSETINLV